MQPESDRSAGWVLRTGADGRVLIEVRQDLAVGEMVRFNSHSSGQTPRPGVICRMESEEGRCLYQAHSGDRITLWPEVPLGPGDWIEKTQTAGCLRIEAVINPEDICFLNGVMEGYSDMAVLRTLDSSTGLVELLASPDYEEQMHELLLSLQQEMPLEIKVVVHGATSVFA